jgi:predicted nucleic acid-binding protein
LKPVTLPIARRAGALMRAYRRSHSGIGLGDCLVGDRRAGSELATLNVRHFPMFEDLRPPFAV